MTEEWKLIPDTDCYYASNFGRIKYNDEILEQKDDGQGYLRLGTSINGQRRINILIAKTFLGEPPSDGQKYMVDHIDNNKKNNRVDNLQYLTNSENQKKRKPFNINRFGCFEKDKRGNIQYIENIAERERELGVVAGSINHCINGERKTTAGSSFFRINGLDKYIEKIVDDVICRKYKGEINK